ncbi:MAG: hypothetical protein PHE68_01045 [Candidatus Peribacteraceae bacterium]|nr:hypothetical protein [Candidatus Peribacteraceae bacterium]MDD5075386.1 hypothetical protein [Candidatus Peribacteraceae bacterium]
MEEAMIPILAVQSSERKVRIIGLLLVIILLLCTIIPFFGVTPFYDGISFVNCFNSGVEQPIFNPLNFRCAGHPFGFLLLIGLTQYIDYQNMMLVHLLNLCIAVGGIIAFYKLLKLFLPHDTRIEQILLTAMYALAPLTVIHIIQPAFDFGLMVFFVIFLYFLLTGKRWWASLIALAVLFTKETGIAVYIGTLSIYALVYILTEGKPWKERVRSLINMWPLCIPGLITIAYYAMLPFLLTENDGIFFPNWKGGETVSLRNILDFDISNVSMQAYLKFIFVLNFNWLLSIFVLAFLLIAFFQRKKASELLGGRNILFTLFLLLTAVVIVTRFRPYFNPRYILLSYPVLLLSFAQALLFFFRKRFMRLSLLLIIFSLIYCSNFRTIDPLSRWTFGTFSVGAKKMLKIAPSINQKDALVYNLESTDISYAQEKLIDDLSPDQNHVLFNDVKWTIVGPARPFLQFRRRFPANIQITYDQTEITIEGSRKFKDPKLLHYVDYPNFQKGEGFEYMKSHYALDSVKTYEHNGFQITLYTFSLPSPEASIAQP